jgi:hypothetical protein
MKPDREQELLDRIRQLEEQNSELRDKLDMIYSIVAPDVEEGVEEDGDPGDDDDGGSRLVQIDAPRKPS